MRRFILGMPLVIAVFLPAGMVWAQSAPLPPDQAFRLSVERAQDDSIAASWTIEEGYYLYRDKMSALLLDADTERPLPLETSPGEPYADPYFGTTEIYYGAAGAAIPFSAFEGIGSAGTIRLTYQGCAEDGICYPPITKSVDVATLAIEADSGSGASVSGTPTSTPATPSGAVEAGNGSLVSGLIADGGFAWLMLSFLGFGLLLALTPCVFPMIPILSGILTRDGETTSARRGFVVSSIYVLAMAGAYGLLGVAAAWSGQNLQMALQSPIAIGMMSVVFVLLALSMFGLFELRLPAALTARFSNAQVGGKGSLASAGFLGFTSALIVGPCVTPPLAGALLYIAQTADVARGASALFALGLGMGLPLVIFGTAGSTLLPRTGVWMRTIQYVFGFLFLGVAVWMSSRVLPAQVTLALWAMLLIGTGVFLGAFDSIAGDATPWGRARKAMGIIAALYGGILIIGAAGGADDPLRPLAMLQAERVPAQDPEPPFTTVVDLQALDHRVAEASSQGKPVFVNFTAEWCVICKEIEREVLSAPQVQARLRDLVLIRADVTAYDAGNRDLMRAFDVIGPPTLLFLDPVAREVTGARIVGPIDADGFLAKLDTVPGA